MGRTDKNNMTKDTKDRKFKQQQPWSYLINTTIEIIDFDNEEPNKITGIGLRTKDGKRLWLGVVIETHTNHYFTFH